MAVDEIDGGEDPGWVKVMANNPSRKIVSAIDLERWLASLEAGDRIECSNAEPPDSRIGEG